MKRSIFLIGLMTLLGFVSQAQNDTMYVMKDGVVINKQAIKSTDVDSIIFYQPKKVQNPTTVTDIDGNVYKVVTIGNQVWMAENLKTTKYNDGTAIPLGKSNIEWSSNIKDAKPMMSYYNDNVANKAVYGGLYNWYVVSNTTNGGKNVCPAGWHVPTDAEWTTLTDYIGGESIGGTSLKTKTGWQYNGMGTENGTDIYGFSGAPSGYRYYANSYCYAIGSSALWCSSTSYNSVDAWTRGLNYSNSNVSRGNNNKGNGYSVRCVKD